MSCFSTLSRPGGPAMGWVAAMLTPPEAVKPITVMRWLCRLVTPPGGLVLDPFAGSGSTVIAAQLEGFDAIGIEREAEYADIARARVRWWAEDADEKARAKTVPNAGGHGGGGRRQVRPTTDDGGASWSKGEHVPFHYDDGKPARTNGHGEPVPDGQMPLFHDSGQQYT